MSQIFTAIVYNSANTHISNDDSIVFGKSHEVDIYGAVTIGGTYFKPIGIGTMKWSRKDDKGKLHNHILKRALYLPDSPVNIIISTFLAYQYDDDNGTYIKTERHSSELSWNFGQ